jgi:tetratricopeptide (TPR) repeat protein
MVGAVAGAIVAAALTLLPLVAMAAESESESEADGARVEQLREQANETLLKGQFDKARRGFEEVLKLRPDDGPAERDAARAASAAGEFEYAVEALERAHHFEQHKPDPELHYLRGEALYVLGRDDEAHREHRIAELEIGLAPAGRMEKLWLARIYARRGYVILADRVYEPMLPPAPKFDTEVALSQADAHLINNDWEGGARLLRRYLALDPANVRAREMLGWALEADGDLDGELAVRGPLARDAPTAGHRRDYGRALERAANFRAARDAYAGAMAAAPGPDATLVGSYQRMRLRTIPEVTGGAELRTDPQAWAWRLQAGAALPFGERHRWAALAWHDESQDKKANQVVGQNVLAESGNVSGVGAGVVLGSRSGGWLGASADARVQMTKGADSNGQVLLGPEWFFKAGAEAELATPIFKYSEINLHADLNEQWNESPVTVEEGGVQTGVIGHLFLFPTSRVVLFDGGAAVRRLSLAPEDGPVPTADQLLAWAGLDFNLWIDGGHVVRGETLDDRLYRRTYLSDAGVLAYRHFELWTHAGPDFRVALAPRESVNNGTLIIRKVLLGGRFGFDVHGGVGYDDARGHILAQGGGALVLAASWSTRLQASYDVSRDWTVGLTGVLQTAWLTLHADL